MSDFVYNESSGAACRLRIQIRGAVQGAGFRPFVFRLAGELRLTGFVNNTSQGVCIEVEGPKEALKSLLLRLSTEHPPHARIASLESSWLDPIGYQTFEIKTSGGGVKRAFILPDISTCPDCLRDILDRNNRRYRYPFANCTHCGPRYTVIVSLPYDRVNTTMRPFQMCQECRREYGDPMDRRFHAQPTACPRCGPQLSWWDSSGKVLAAQEDALKAAAQALRDGKILALKGLGGYQLLVDARNDDAVKLLRERKHREEKPFALMFPSLEHVKSVCDVSDLEARLLLSPEAPIVLLKKSITESTENTEKAVNSNDITPSSETNYNKPLQQTSTDDSPIAPSLNPSQLSTLNSQLSTSLAPGNPYLGVMLPYTPLHHLLLSDLGFPVVATSGNLSDEPICIDDQEAVQRLGGIADFFLAHNRPIARPVDDSVARVLMDRELVMRRARGYAPLPITTRQKLPPFLAVGGHLKNTVGISIESEVFISQHIGDLDTPAAFASFQRVVNDFQSLYDFKPAAIICDAHPDYRSTQYAESTGLPLIRVQHHHAHVAACMAENDLEPPALGISWDGTGYGLDGTIWGGEFLSVTGVSFRRVATFRSFRLPGGEAAIKEPRRVALGLLYEIFGPEVFTMRDLLPVRAFAAAELEVFKQMLPKGLNAPVTTSVGRLFDAVASLTGLRQATQYEGQSAMMLEWALPRENIEQAYPLRLKQQVSANEMGRPMNLVNPAAGNPQASIIVDWEPLVWGILDDVRRRTPESRIAALFHNCLVEAAVEVARMIGQERVVLSGGCFQNRYLTERMAGRLRQAGFRPYWHQRIPPNDGGVALGQVMAAAWGKRARD